MDLYRVTDMPVSANSLRSTQTGRVYRTKRYKAWLHAAAQELAIQRKRQIDGGFVVTITVDRARRRANQDLDNLIKSVLDALEMAGVIHNDKHCESLTILWAPVQNSKYAVAIAIDAEGGVAVAGCVWCSCGRHVF
jgi:Holliday junction resolvase RusA-like endonuclease